MTSRSLPSTILHNRCLSHQRSSYFSLSIVFLVLLLSFLFISDAKSEIIEISVPELTGIYTRDEWRRTATFDMGHPVAEVHQAWIRRSGTITYGVGRGDGLFRPPDDIFDWPCHIDAIMDTLVSVWYMYTGPIEGSFQDTTTFFAIYDQNWDFLNDGSGDLTIELHLIEILGAVLVESPIAQLDTVSLIFDLDLATEVDNTATWGEIKSQYRDNTSSR